MARTVRTGRRLLPGLLVTALLLVFAGAGTRGQPAAEQEQDPGAPAAAEQLGRDALAVGQDIFSRYCSACHGRDGGGGLGPALAGNRNLDRDEYVVARILLGGGGMPPFHARLSEGQLAAVASYVRTAWGNDFGALPAERFARQWWRGAEDPAALYARVCARCHGAEGGGFIGPPFVANPNLASAPYVAAKILQGGGGMPSFSGLLSDEQVAALATHIRTAWGNTFGPVDVDVVEQARPQAAQQNQAQQDPGGGLEPAAGAPIYEANCRVCHGSRGTGGVAPALAGNPELQDVRYVVSRIVMGGGGMPSFNEELSSADIAAVATYIRSSWGNTFGSVGLAQVQDLHGGHVPQAPQGGQQQGDQGQQQQGQEPQGGQAQPQGGPPGEGDQGP